MSDPTDNRDSEYRHHDATPGSAPDRSSKAAVPDSFPASDPMATTSAVGSRAVDPADFMYPNREQITDAATVDARFPSLEAARRAIEHLVHGIPLDRRRMTIQNNKDHFTVEVAVPESDTARVIAMLRQCAGKDVLSRAQQGARDLSGDVAAELMRLRAQVERLLRERASSAMSSAASTAGGYAQEAKQAVAGEAERAVALVQERPLMVIAVTAGVAFLLGWLSNGRG